MRLTAAHPLSHVVKFWLCVQTALARQAKGELSAPPEPCTASGTEPNKRKGGVVLFFAQNPEVREQVTELLKQEKSKVNSRTINVRAAALWNTFSEDEKGVWAQRHAGAS